MFSGPNTGYFFMLVTTFGHKKISVQKLKTSFFQDKFYSLKAHAHYFTVLIYLATWGAVNFGIFSHFMSTNLSQCSQSSNLLMYVYYTDSELLFMSAWSQLWLHFFVLLLPKKFSVLLPGFCNRHLQDHFLKELFSIFTWIILLLDGFMMSSYVNMK